MGWSSCCEIFIVPPPPGVPAICVCVQGTGKLSLVVWNRFLLHLMPRTTEQERALYFEIASRFADNLDVLGFMDLRQARAFVI